MEELLKQGNKTSKHNRHILKDYSKHLHEKQQVLEINLDMFAKFTLMQLLNGQILYRNNLNVINALTKESYPVTEGLRYTLRASIISERGYIINAELKKSNEFHLVVYDITSGKILKTLSNTHANPITIIKEFQNDCIASYSEEDNVVNISNLSTGECIAAYKQPHGKVNDMAQVLEDKLALALENATIVILESANGKNIKLLRGHTSSVRNLCTKSNNELISCSFDKTIRVWDVTSGICNQVIKNDYYMGNIAILSQEKVVSVELNYIKIWDINTGKCINNLYKKDFDGADILFMMSDGRIVSASKKVIILWDFAILSLEIKNEKTFYKILDIPYIYLADPDNFQVDKKFNISFRDKEDNSAIILATNKNLFGLVKKLVLLGSDINVINKEGCSAFLLAAKNGYYDIVQFLILQGVQINQTDKEGNSALLLAAQNNHKDIFEILMKYNVNIKQCNNQKQNILHLAAQNNSNHVLSHIITKYLNDLELNAQDVEGVTPLMIACKRGHVTIVELLLSLKNIQIGLANNQGNTSLCLAIINNHFEIVKLLHKKDANLYDENKQLCSPVLLSVINRHTEITAYLTEQNIKIDSQKLEKINARIAANYKEAQKSYKNKQYEAAYDLLCQIDAIIPNYQDTQKMLKELKPLFITNTNKSLETSSSTLLISARSDEQIKLDNSRTSLPKSDKIEKDSHQKGEDYFKRGQSYLKKQNYTKAKEYFNKAADLAYPGAQEKFKEMTYLLANSHEASDLSKLVEIFKPELVSKDSKITIEVPYTALTFGKELGEGGFGTVYQGAWQLTPVAIKKLSVKNLSANALKDFINEGELMSQLRHPHVVAFYKLCSEKNNYCIVMEYCQKGSLYDWLQTSEANIWLRSFTIASEIGMGLNYLHDHNILHRDLKSRNILLDENGKAKISDFGLSTIKTESATTSSASASKGTLRWQAPELINGEQMHHSKETDVYSYGMLLWEIAAKKIPFKEQHNDTVVGLWIAQGKREVIPKETPSHFKGLIERCWSERTQRPTAKQAVEILNQDKNALPAEPQFKKPAASETSHRNYRDNSHDNSAPKQQSHRDYRDNSTRFKRP